MTLVLCSLPKTRANTAAAAGCLPSSQYRCKLKNTEESLQAEERLCSSLKDQLREANAAGEATRKVTTIGTKYVSKELPFKETAFFIGSCMCSLALYLVIPFSLVPSMSCSAALKIHVPLLELISCSTRSWTRFGQTRVESCDRRPAPAKVGATSAKLVAR